MSTIQFPDQELIEEQAANWIAAIDRGISAEEEEELCDWLLESPVNGDLLLQLATTWDLLDVLSPIAKLMPLEQHVKNNVAKTKGKVISRQSKPNKSITYFAVAASLVTVVIAVVLNLKVESPTTNKQAPITTTATVKPNEQRYATVKGERSDITLADGSEVQLNTDSEVVVRYDDLERHLDLKKGEAYFTVASNPQRPFVVQTLNNRVTAVGTAFSVDVSTSADTEVLVSEGRVKIDRQTLLAPSSGNTRAIANNETPLYLTRGQRALLHGSEATISDDQDIDSALAWREGRIVFSGETLQEVVAEIGRYSHLEFSITDAEIASIRVGGFFKTGDLTQLLNVLEQNFGVHSERHDDQILLSKAN